MEAGTKAKYSTKGRSIYRPSIKKLIAENIPLDRAGIEARFTHLSTLAEAKGDIANALRGTEDLAKLGGLMKESPAPNMAIFTDILPSLKSVKICKPNDSNNIPPITEDIIKDNDTPL